MRRTLPPSASTPGRSARSRPRRRPTLPQADARFNLAASAEARALAGRGRASERSPLRAIRASLRLLALGATTSATVLAWFACAVVARRARDRWRGLVLRAWARSAAFIMGMRIKTTGPVPRPPCFLVANHLSYVDVVLLWSKLDCTFLAKSEVESWPVVGFLARTAGTCFVDRRNPSDLVRVGAELRRVLESGRSVAIFPEGTSSDGRGVLSFKPPLFEVALRSGVPVRCAGVSYRTRGRDPSARLAVAWWGDMEFLPHFWALLGLSGFDAAIDFAPAEVEGADRKELAAAAWQAVSARFRPVPG